MTPEQFEDIVRELYDPNSKTNRVARDLTLYRKCTRKKKRTRYDYEAEHEYNNETNENDYTL